MNALAIRIALHYHYCNDDYEGGTGAHWGSEAVQQAIKTLLAHKMLEETNKGGSLPEYIGTRGLTVYVRKLCTVKLPYLDWVFPNEPFDEE